MTATPATHIESPWLVPFDAGFRVAQAPTRHAEAPDKKTCKKRLGALIKEMGELQRRLYAEDRRAVLLVFQAMDAAGKDSTIRASLGGVDPAGFQVYSFKQPSAEELDHDFLWRTAQRLPQRGRIGVFNRSYYEEVLVVRVHPEYLAGQKLPGSIDHDRLWQERYESIRDHEKHLARNGTVIIKFWLNVSREEQRKRFLSRLEEPEKNWKFSSGDVAERAHWGSYMQAYEAALNATSRPWAPWYAIPADHKPYLRLCVAETIVETLRGLDPRYPEVGAAEQQEFSGMRELLGRD
ncbi:MAG: polyphosphate kinase 2 family protein [Pseudomonadota bacterium]